MTGSLEACGLFNLLMDAALLAVVARANGCLSFRRVLLCACIAAGYSLLTIAVPTLAHPLVQLPLLFPISLILCGSGDAHRWGSVAFQLLCGAALIGGLCALFPPRTLLALCLTLSSALLALHILYAVRHKRMFTWEVRVSLCFQGKSIRFPALIDTGNRLREPMSGLPVLIAEASLLDGLLGGELAPGLTRQVAFGGLGGCGTVRCFHPDHVWICRGGQLIPAPEIWVAVYPGRIPGMQRALAPPSFAIIPGKYEFQ